MPTIDELRQRSEQLFASLLVAQTTRPRARGVGAANPPTFSWFRPEDALSSSALSFRLAALAASRPDANDGLAAALDHAQAQRRHAHPEQVRQGLALFVTHNHDGHLLTKPRTVTAAPRLFPRTPPPRRRPVSIGGASPQLDYWREDALANEHHQHWHEVYPYTGLPPSDFRAWVTATPKADLVAILTALAPGRNWSQIVGGATVPQLADLFAQVASSGAVGNLPRDMYRKLFTLNDRQGELFFYMHAQMLARYDAELLSNGLPQVAPFGPQTWARPIPEGHNPVGLVRFGRRGANVSLRPNDVAALRAMNTELGNALSTSKLAGPTGTVGIDRTNFGEAVEATTAQLRDLDPGAYPGLHNTGHGAIAALSTAAPGVMTSTVTAIRDQIFWRWHKHIDNLGATWQDEQEAYGFADKPNVVLRNDLAANATPWASPDIIVCRTADLPADADLQSLGAQLFGGVKWNRDFSGGAATAGAITISTVSELTTAMASRSVRGEAVRYLTHTPFSYFLRIENRRSRAVNVTVRIYLVPASVADQRRAWIEMDKFLLALPARAKLVAYRADTESSVVKKPAEADPGAVTPGGVDPGERSYCDCGWPYTLLLPRGTTPGMAFRLMVMCTDAAIDKVPGPEECGSMSYCGAKDRYPDTRDMGYPFARPFTGPPATAIRDTIITLGSAAARTITIRHT